MSVKLGIRQLFSIDAPTNYGQGQPVQQMVTSSCTHSICNSGYPRFISRVKIIIIWLIPNSLNEMHLQGIVAIVFLVLKLNQNFQRQGGGQGVLGIIDFFWNYTMFNDTKHFLTAKCTQYTVMYSIQVETHFRQFSKNLTEIKPG